MIEIRRTAIAFDEEELIELEQIITDQDTSEALVFLRKSVYNKIARSQQAKLQSHLYSGGDPVKGFQSKNI